jgi:hypothetical protein
MDIINRISITSIICIFSNSKCFIFITISPKNACRSTASRISTTTNLFQCLICTYPNFSSIRSYINITFYWSSIKNLVLSTIDRSELSISVYHAVSPFYLISFHIYKKKKVRENIRFLSHLYSL